jgi:protein gp37
MNHTKIETCDLTWNPITGCEHKCWFCYAKRGYDRFGWSFKPTFHPERIKELADLKPPSGRGRKSWIAEHYPGQWLVFVCSVSDLFAPWTLDRWRDETLERIGWTPDHIICQLLTKSPEGISNESTFNKNVWLGVSVTCQDDVTRIGTLLDVPSEGKFFAYIEPLLGPVEIPNDLLKKLDWMVVGKLTGFSRKVAAINRYWVDGPTGLIAQARRYHIPIFLKNTIIDEFGPEYAMRDFPK